MIKALQDWLFDWWLESMIYHHPQNYLDREYGPQRQHGQLWHDLNPKQIIRMKFNNDLKPRLVYVFSAGEDG
ncbi:hypothetical protein E0H80_06225 [Acinetobacter sp. ANC 4779]|uniref:hypothetical protein n=1 Tax=Acinetobacter sp. ANC 4779 TaxID=2529848 RepID=UPI00103B87BA|nr:hypothetical protein [Acinetobacter sp. ANC 4779]TCB50961.1 hypothetical protein E0H80_06225 [Acinetobacter sp. ANC 4779]